MVRALSRANHLQPALIISRLRVLGTLFIFFSEFADVFSFFFVQSQPDRPDELVRIEAAGGRVIYWDGARVLGMLAMSRAIGDSYLKPYVISEPEVTVTDRTDDDECLILASDGLWDVVSNDTACGVVRMCLRAQKPPSPPRSPGSEAALSSAASSDKACSDASILLTKLALARHSTDNVSVVVVDLRRRNQSIEVSL